MQALKQDAKMRRDMKRKFAVLLVAVLRILEDKVNVNLRMLEIYIRQSPLSDNDIIEFQEDDIEELRGARSVSHVFSIICKYISFDSYLLLEDVVEQFGNDEAKDMMQQYIRELEKFHHNAACPREVPNHTHEHHNSCSNHVGTILQLYHHTRCTIHIILYRATWGYIHAH